MNLDNEAALVEAILFLESEPQAEKTIALVAGLSEDVVKKALEAEGMRVEVDGRSEKIGYKIREAQLEKVPYMIIVGDKDIEASTVSLQEGICNGFMVVPAIICAIAAILIFVGFRLTPAKIAQYQREIDEREKLAH